MRCIYYIEHRPSKDAHIILHGPEAIQGCPQDFTSPTDHPRMPTGFYIAHRPSKDDHIILHGPTTIQRWPQNFTWANAIMPIWFYMGHQPSKDAPGFYMDHQPSKDAHRILHRQPTIQTCPHDFTWSTDHPRMTTGFYMGYWPSRPSKDAQKICMGYQPSKDAHIILQGSPTIQGCPQNFTWTTDQVDHSRMFTEFKMGTDHPIMPKRIYMCHRPFKDDHKISNWPPTIVGCP